MRVTRVVLAVAFAAFAVAAWAKYDAASHPKLSFAERWAPVDEAVQSGGFRHQ
jgi:cytochrome c-type biogenesis protein CcmH/NrfG